MTILDSIVNTSLALTIYSKNTLEVLSQLLTSNSTTRHHARPHLHLISTFPSHSSPSITTIAASLGSNVSIKHSIYREAYSEPASSYIIRSRASGSRTIVNYNELPEMTAKEFVDTVSRLRAGSEGQAGDEAQAPSSVEGSDTDYWFHFEGRIPDVTLRCVRYLRKAIPRVKISLEVEKPNREGLEDLAGEADVVFYSRSWAAAKGYGDAESCVRGQAKRTKAPLSICTWGEGRAALWNAGGERLYMSDAVRVPAEMVVDTIGAGDTFIAGMLFGLFRNHEEDVGYGGALSFATQLAGLKVQRDGFDGLSLDVFRDPKT